MTLSTVQSRFAVKNIDYNAKGQRELIEYGNGVQTTYEYDDKTFRRIHLSTVRGTKRLQDLFYAYDPAGNIIAIRDDAQQTIYFDGQVVRPDAEYKYDAIYRLIEATGREHIGQALIPHTTWNDQGRVNLAHPHDGQKMRRYFEFYEYDEVGNIKRFDHKAHNGNWIRAYYYNEVSLIELGKKSNRLSQTIVHPNGQDPIPEPYTHDPHGNMTSMLHLQQMKWDFEDQLHSVEKGSEEIYYVYDAAGQRVRKVVEKNNNGCILWMTSSALRWWRLAPRATILHRNNSSAISTATTSARPAWSWIIRRRSSLTKSITPTAARPIRRCAARPRRRSDTAIRARSGMRRVGCTTTERGIMHRG
jgi:hypothetical protein